MGLLLVDNCSASGAPRGCLHPLARSALAHYCSWLLIEISISRVICVAIRTLGLSSIYGRDGLASKEVLAATDWLHVRWIDAKSRSTDVIEIEPFRNWANQRLVGPAMWSNNNKRRVAHPENAIAARWITAPKPTGICLVNKAPKSDFYRNRFRSHQSILYRINRYVGSIECAQGHSLAVDLLKSGYAVTL